MARAFFTDLAVLINTSGFALGLASIEVTVTQRSGGAVQIYSDATSGSVKANPFVTGASGDISFWAPYGSYNVTIADTQGVPRIATRTVGWDAVPYSDVFAFNAAIEAAKIRPVVAVLPVSPANGEEIYYQSAATAAAGTGQIWHLRYNAAATTSNKWQFLGGASFHSSLSATEVTTSTVYTDLGIVGPSITVPLAGVYLFTLCCGMYANTSPVYSEAALKIGTAAGDPTSAISAVTPVGTTSLVNDVSKTVMRAVAAGDICKMVYLTSAGTSSFLRRTLTVTPVRIG